ncbi:MAG: ATP-grasp domain-containing protein [Desulfobacterales bacterium]|nr:ATP-grasp domain-containing protein [Desulfobacterales bacterium]
MIVSFHPCFGADKYIICAGRKPDDNDLAAIKAADAVILSQGRDEALYKMASKNCSNVFPDYEARFKYPGKIGQIHLFRKAKVPHPESIIYFNVDSFKKDFDTIPEKFSFPIVFKFDWGGEGDNVFLLNSVRDLEDALNRAEIFESTGHTGFLIQEYIPSQSRSLRVVVIGQKFISYWRIQNNAEEFCTSLASGAVLDFDADPDLQEAAVKSAKHFCKKTGINLAGFDFLFSSELNIKEPLFLEINYFFGRKGLGGSEKYYKILESEIQKWIESLKLNEGK